MMLLDRSKAILPDGRRAETLRRTPLHAALCALGIPGIDPKMAKPELLDRYAARLVEEASKLRPEQRDGQHPAALTPAVAWRVAAMIAQQAAERRGA